MLVSANRCHIVDCCWNQMTQISLKLPSLNGSSSCGLASLLRRYPRVLLVLVVTLLLVAGFTVVWVSYTPPRKTDYYTDIGSHNYGVVIDAGSSGSKVQLFHWPPHDGDPTRLLKIEPVVDKMGDMLVTRVHPGISTFASQPEKAFDSLRPLLDYAVLHIPHSKHSETSLYILCTAGMRLLPSEEQERITSLLYRTIPATYPFHLPQDGIEVIPGKLEGVFSWITINYLLGHFEPETHRDSTASGGNSTPLGVNTAGSLDMGGASLQIAFEIPPDVEAPSANTVDINLGCGTHDNHHKHRVYVNTYLGYGTNEARRRYLRLLRQQHLTSSSNKNQSVHSALVHDPCSPLNMQENITVGRHTLRVRGLGDFTACKTALAPILLNSSLATATPLPDSSCSGTSCKISEFQRPSQKYDSLEFYGTSEFWYTMRDVLRIGGKYRAAVFESAAKDYCRTEWRILQDRFQKKLYPYADSFRLKTQCVKSAWMSLVLHEGFGFPEERTVLHSTASINGCSVQWSLGALLYHTRYLPLREIQLQQMHKTTASSIGMTTNHLLTTLTESSFTLPFIVVISVAVLLLLCRQRRPRYYTLSRNASHVSLGRNTSHMSLGRNQSSSRLSITAASSGSSNTSFYLKGAG